MIILERMEKGLCKRSKEVEQWKNQKDRAKANKSRNQKKIN